MTTPLVILGDGWQNPSGLARIARDLHGVIGGSLVGFHPPGLLVDGKPGWYSWSHLGEDYGASIVVPQLAERFGPEGVLFIIWDPSRAIEYLPLVRRQLPGWTLWGYFAVDGHDYKGRVDGPAGQAIEHFDRVLAYTAYGAGVIRTVRNKPTQWLPHGHQITAPPYYSPEFWQENFPRYYRDGKGWLLGCVATNQPRKDLRLFCALLQTLRQQGHRVYGWLHTDVLQKTWNVPLLLQQYHLEKVLRVTTGTLADQTLLQCYQTCTAVVGIGRGEGFGYPTMEALAVGTPALEMDYAGGAEHVPPQWRYRWEGIDYTNPYAIGRPLGQLEDLVEKVLGICTQGMQDRRTLEAYCRGSVAHLHWDALKPRWQSWVRKGLEDL